MSRAFRTNLIAIWRSWWDSSTYQILQYYCYTCQFDILLSMTTENLSDALMYGSYHSGITATRTSQHCGKLSENSVYSVSGTFIGQVDFAETTEMENRNGNIERKKIVLATVLRQELYSFLVRLLHAGQRGDWVLFLLYARNYTPEYNTIYASSVKAIMETVVQT